MAFIRGLERSLLGSITDSITSMLPNFDNTSGIESVLNPKGDKRGIMVDEKRRTILKGGLATMFASFFPGIALAGRSSKMMIPEEARNRIWGGKQFLEMRNAIDKINSYVKYNERDESDIEYILFPNARPRGTVDSNKIAREMMGTPQYWLLLRCWLNDDMGVYKAIFEGTNVSKGVPPLQKGRGVWHFARALSTVATHSIEADLLRALYIGANGEPNGAEPIINETYQNIHAVQRKVKEWENKGYTPFSTRGNELLAYLFLTITSRLQDQNLLAISSMMIGDYYEKVKKNQEKSDIVFGMITKKLLTENKQFPQVAIYNKERNTVSESISIYS